MPLGVRRVHMCGERRLWLGTAGEDEPRRQDLAANVALRHRRADDAAAAVGTAALRIAAFAQRRHEAQRREHAGAGADRGAADDLVEALPRQHREPAGHLDAAAARRDAGERRRRACLGHHRVEDAEPGQRVVGVGDEAVAADLVARKGMLVDEDDAAARLREQLRGGAAGRAGADDDDVAALGEEVDAEVQDVRALSDVDVDVDAMPRAPICHAAATASAVRVPMSAKVS